ncbi:DUF4267 domain-containing protein [Amycolatopsis jiangsuensis]|uniref:DUF4267 domain-containing protein n=1 Tax=Amycolatopsis jiangsuensis TaxID=1181879 RepID=A0A840INA7_9PSEU|nr:DUF4267 domain-containing protein [Amycolatopsis jiangsuensis]MBB4683039.1 hypothetical protein [Amycolatopsis jiangsuensis]
MIVTAYVLAGVIAAGIIYIGITYLLTPEKAAATFGLPVLPAGSTAFFRIKGDRDVASGLALGAAMLAGSPQVVGWIVLAESFAAFSDMLIVLRYRGKRALAFGVHGATGLVMVAIALTLVLA